MVAMTYRKTLSLAGVLLAITVLALAPHLWRAHAQQTNPKPEQTSVHYTPNRQREDWTILAGQTSVVTALQARNGYVEVFRNGALLRHGKDYTTVHGATLRVNFVLAPSVGDYVTLFYYPN